MKKPKILIEILNYFNYCFLQLCSFLHKASDTSKKNLLFIQTGGIGDLVISAKIFEYESIFSTYNKIYFVMRGDISSLLTDISGKVEIIKLDLSKYRYNLIYRVSFLRRLRKKNISEVYNLTSARSAWNDSLALCINAEKRYCNDNNWLTVYPFWKKRIQSKYTKVFNSQTFNEYERIESTIQFFSNTEKLNLIINSPSKPLAEKKYDIVIAPFSSEYKRNWELKKFIEVVDKYSSSKNILLLCSKEQNKNVRNIIEFRKIDVAAGKYKLNELFSVIENSRIFIGLDSGITHIALKTSATVIALIGGGNFGRYLPKPNDSKNTYLAYQTDCFGCEWYCHKPEMECLSRIMPNQVIENINKILVDNENS